jgi:hypothetical protein
MKVTVLTRSCAVAVLCMCSLAVRAAPTTWYFVSTQSPPPVPPYASYATLLDPSNNLGLTVVGSFSYDPDTNMTSNVSIQINMQPYPDPYWPALSFTSPAAVVNPNASSTPGIVSFEFLTGPPLTVGTTYFVVTAGPFQPGATSVPIYGPIYTDLGSFYPNEDISSLNLCIANSNPIYGPPVLCGNCPVDLICPPPALPPEAYWAFGPWLASSCGSTLRRASMPSQAIAPAMAKQAPIKNAACQDPCPDR